MEAILSNSYNLSALWVLFPFNLSLFDYKSRKEETSEDNEREDVGKRRADFEDNVPQYWEGTGSTKWWSGATITLKEEERYSFRQVEFSLEYRMC